TDWPSGRGSLGASGPPIVRTAGRLPAGDRREFQLHRKGVVVGACSSPVLRRQGARAPWAQLGCESETRWSRPDFALALDRWSFGLQEALAPGLVALAGVGAPARATDAVIAARGAPLQPACSIAQGGRDGNAVGGGEVVGLDD